MSDTYHYEEGAIHNDHKKVLQIGNVGVSDVGKLLGAFFSSDIEDAVIEGNDGKEFPDSRQAIVDELSALAENGDWVNGIKADDIKKMLSAILGLEEGVLTKEQMVLSGKLWLLLEGGRKGENGRVRIVWQNIVGFLDEKRLFKQKGSSALNKDFFGDRDGYTNIDKGRPKRADMSKGFREILQLLEDFAPKLPKKG